MQWGVEDYRIMIIWICVEKFSAAKQENTN